jgi:hypothetical protein
MDHCSSCIPFCGLKLQGFTTAFKELFWSQKLTEQGAYAHNVKILFSLDIRKICTCTSRNVCHIIHDVSEHFLDMLMVHTLLYRKHCHTIKK